MKPVKLTEKLAVSGQIGREQVAAIAAAGYRVLINNRPDGEEAGQPDSAAIAEAAAQAGLVYHYLPVTAASFPGPDVERMRRLLDGASGPVFAFCRSGTRCANLWVATRGVDERPQADALARRLGFDLAMAARVQA
jgi:uncharacterized protein (TIGR01244 family)